MNEQEQAQVDALRAVVELLLRPPSAAAARAPHEALTPREHDVLCLLARGMSNKAIARLLGIGLGTVKSHVKSIFCKLGARCRTEAVSIALGLSLSAPPGPRPHRAQLGSNMPFLS